ncbi:IclR family transcriptional regulator [Pandoraea sp.]|uniref:IclR family transcriptional regulator n=1 Tax=Pandoraea sp. TaxID=1883445 RepID=UPI0035B0AC11
MTSTPPSTPEFNANSSDHKLLRVLRMLERISISGEPATIAQIAMRLEIPKASAARLVDMLVGERFLTRMPNERGLIPGPRSTSLALSTLNNNSFRRLCRAVLRSIVDKLGETCNVSALDGDRVLYLERVETAEPLRMHLDLGSRHPLHCTAGGKLFLSQMSLLERSALLDRIPLVQATPRSLTNRSALDSELNRLRDLGYGVDAEEFVVGMVGVAVPVLIGSRRCGMALVCHAASARSSLDRLITQLPLLREGAKQLQTLFDDPCASLAPDA